MNDDRHEDSEIPVKEAATHFQSQMLSPLWTNPKCALRSKGGTRTFTLSPLHWTILVAPQLTILVVVCTTGTIIIIRWTILIAPQLTILIVVCTTGTIIIVRTTGTIHPHSYDVHHSHDMT
ncbi:hypothetical protein BD769DRAFT_1665685 [Suillus cothurnatus]|nr:hypothetical protein BD769DRAFT_1665685 [Suillus cothurnatus]